jgi:hypothetical protein
MATNHIVPCERSAAATSTYDSTTQRPRHSCQHITLSQRNGLTSQTRTSRLLSKRATNVLDYPIAKGIPIERIDTHSLRSRGANALSLAGFSDTQIQKMGQWRGATFKEYVREELACFSEGMSTRMKQKFHFVNVAGNSMYDITENIIASEYTVNASQDIAPAA